MHRLLVLPLLVGCRGVEPHGPPTTVATAAASTPKAPAADSEDMLLRRRPIDEPRIEVRRAWTPAPGDGQSARDRLARCCAELEQLAEAATSDERAGLMLNALDCNAMRDDRAMDPHEALGKLRVGLEGGPVPAACK